MEATTGVRTRRLRLIAIAVSVLCALALAAPSSAWAAGAQHDPVHAVKIVALASSDHHLGGSRPAHQRLVAVSSADGPVHVGSFRRADAPSILSTVSVDSARTRGPPGQAR